MFWPTSILSLLASKSSTAARQPVPLIVRLQLVKLVMPQAGVAPFACGVMRSTQVLPDAGVVVALNEIPTPVVEVPEKRTSPVIEVQPAGAVVGEATVGQVTVGLFSK